MVKDSRDSSLATEKRKRSSSSVDAANETSSSSSSKHSHRDKDKRKHKKQSRHSTSSKYSDAESSGVESGAESSASGASRSSDGKRKEKSHKKHRSKDDKKKNKSDAPPYLTTQPLSSAFESQYPVTTISIPPIHSSDPKLAVTELFDSLIMRFIPPLNGVLVSHGQIFFLTPDGRNVAESASVHPGPSALIDGDGAFAKVKVAVECCVWRPRIGAKIEGTITLSTPSHVSLLINSTFNASIPSSHLTDFEFVEEDEADMDEDKAMKAEDDEEESSVLAIAGGQGSSGSGGYWRSKKSKQRLGGATNGRIEFAVIGLTIAGHTLSVSGSLLARPFSVPPPRTLSLQQQAGSVAQRAAAFGFGDGSRGADANGTGDDGFSKAKRRVRWEEDEDEDDADDESGDDESPDEADRRQAPAKVKSTHRSAKGSKHVKF